MEQKSEYEVVFYETSGGSCPAEEFLAALPVKIRAKTAKWIEMLERYGPDLTRPYVDIVRGKIRELRIIFGWRQFRFLYFFCGKYIVITHGFIKKTERVTENELVRAQNIMYDFQDRLKKGEIKL